MPPRAWRVRIEDILEAIDRVEQYVTGMDYDAFVADSRTVQAVEQNIEIIGEATANLPNELVDKWPDAPWYQMRGMRNVIANEYFGVDTSIVWKTATDDLPLLRPMLRKMLGNSG